MQDHARTLGGVEVDLTVGGKELSAGIVEVDRIGGGVDHKGIEVIITVEVTQRYSAAVHRAKVLRTLREIARPIVEPDVIRAIVDHKGVEVQVVVDVAERHAL